MRDNRDMTKPPCPDCGRDKVTGKSSIYCWTCYDRRRKTGTLPAGHTRGDMRHMLTLVDLDAGTAVCSVCGPTTPYRKKSSTNLQCWNKVKGYHEDQKTRRYTLTLAERSAMLEAQGGGCAVCGATGQMHIDHDHACCPGRDSCGKCVRGILCGPCNKGIGMLGDDPARLLAAAEYLR